MARGAPIVVHFVSLTQSRFRFSPGSNTGIILAGIGTASFVWGFLPVLAARYFIPKVPNPLNCTRRLLDSSNPTFMNRDSSILLICDFEYPVSELISCMICSFVIVFFIDTSLCISPSGREEHRALEDDKRRERRKV